MLSFRDLEKFEGPLLRKTEWGELVPAPGFEPGTIWYLRWLTPGHCHVAQGAVCTYSQTLYQVELRRDCET